MSQSYEIVSVQRAKSAPGADGSNWQRYVISYEGTDSIRGYRQGSVEDVTLAVEAIVARLNERHAGRYSKAGRVHLVLTPKKKDAETA